MLASLAAALLLSPSGLAGKWSFTMLGKGGHRFLAGNLSFTAGKPTRPGEINFDGVKKITFPHRADEMKQAKDVAATLTGKKVWIDLNRGWADNNYFLTGQLTAAGIRGTWGHSTFAGIRERGTFTMTRLK